MEELRGIEPPNYSKINVNENSTHQQMNRNEEIRNKTVTVE